jgi:hypothetical protein
MKARLQRRRRETAMLVERAQGVMRESRKLLEQREVQLKQLEQFLEERATIPHEIEGDNDDSRYASLKSPRCSRV